MTGPCTHELTATDCLHKICLYKIQHGVGVGIRVCEHMSPTPVKELVTGDGFLERESQVSLKNVPGRLTHSHADMGSTN